VTSPPLIAHVLFRLDIGGMENGIVNLVNLMPADRFRHAIVALAGVGEFARRIRRSDVTVYSLHKAPGKDPAAYLRLYRLLRTLRPAIVHTRNVGTVDCQVVAALAGVPCRIHGEHGWQLSNVRGDDARGRRLRRLCAPFVHRYVAMSRDIGSWLIDEIGVPAAKVTQIYNGVDTTRFSPEGPVPADLPWEQGAARPVVIGTVGRLDPIKNHSGLLAAFRRLLELVPGSGPDVRLMIVGTGGQEDALRRQVIESGLEARVWLAGPRDDVPELMRSMDVFVLPSFNEGISNTLLEAMASGRPVLAGRVGGNPEVLVEGITGSLFDPGDTEALAALLRDYVLDPGRRAAEGAAARAHVAETFTLESMVDGYVKLYESVMEGRV